MSRAPSRATSPPPRPNPLPAPTTQEIVEMIRRLRDYVATHKDFRQDYEDDRQDMLKVSAALLARISDRPLATPEPQANIGERIKSE